MSAPNLKSEIMSRVKELEHIRQRVLPIKVGRAAVNQVEDNFRNSGFYGSSWKEPIRRTAGFNGTAGSNKTLLSGRNHLSRSTKYQPMNAKVKIYNPVEYAAIHNSGGTITVTAKMKKYFWHKHYETRDSLSLTKKGKIRNNQRNLSLNREADFWRKMALKRVGSKIRIPRRQFVGQHKFLQMEIDRIIKAELKTFINGTHSRSNH